MKMQSSPLSREGYIKRALDLYRNVPGTLGRIRREDRLLAADLYARGIALSTLESALVLAAARRCFRPENAQPLSPIRSLHYFLPVIDELLANPPATEYLAYLKSKLKSHTAKAVPSLQ